MMKAKYIALAAFLEFGNIVLPSCSSIDLTVPHKYTSERLTKIDEFEQKIKEHFQRHFDDVVARVGFNGGYYHINDIPHPKLVIESRMFHETRFYLEHPYYLYKNEKLIPKISVLETQISKGVKNRELESLLNEFGIINFDLKTKIDDNFINITLTYKSKTLQGEEETINDYELTYPKLSGVGSVYKAARAYIEEKGDNDYVSEPRLRQIEKEHGVVFSMRNAKSLNLLITIDFTIVVITDRYNSHERKPFYIIFGVDEKSKERFI